MIIRASWASGLSTLGRGPPERRPAGPRTQRTMCTWPPSESKQTPPAISSWPSTSAASKYLPPTKGPESGDRRGSAPE
eukprot:2599070-Alexandrium_andersonii.AAC.1